MRTAAALYCTVLYSTVLYCIKIRKFAQNRYTNRQTNKQTDREFNYRGHSYPLWIVGVSGPILLKCAEVCESVWNFFRIRNNPTYAFPTLKWTNGSSFENYTYEYPTWLKTALCSLTSLSQSLKNKVHPRSHVKIVYIPIWMTRHQVWNINIWLYVLLPYVPLFWS